MGCKILNLMLRLFLVLFLSVAVVADDGYKRCEHAVKNWASNSADSEVKDDKHTLRDLLFFLHVPRTGGRTYFHCFLKKMYSNSQECPRSYDKLRFNPRKSNCRLLSTHDDYSMMSKLPKGKTSVVTILRDPIERVFSTYEFSVEVAARFLIHPNLTSVARMAQRVRRKTSGVSTLDIWPWKYLVPWMTEDLYARKDARKLRGQVHLVTNNSYDMEDVLIPLHEYINDPIAQDIIHNGATFQIVGLTNNSYFPEAHEVRHCVLKYRSLGKYVLEVAKKKLDDMLYVGLTENHKESANMFANIVGSQVISQHTSSTSSSDGAEQSSVLLKTKSDANEKGNNTYQTLKNVTSTAKDGAAHEKLTVKKLMESYESCISSLRKSQSERRVNSLQRISPANFTKEARRKVPEELIQEIAMFNSLDIDLYKYAQDIFKKQRAHIVQSMVFDERLVGPLSTSTNPASFYNSPSLKSLFSSLSALMLLLFIFLFVNARRRTSKVKL